jgi:hypothetical protein
MAETTLTFNELIQLCVDEGWDMDLPLRIHIDGRGGERLYCNITDVYSNDGILVTIKLEEKPWP